MTRDEAIAYVVKHGLFVSAGPVPDGKAKYRRGVMSWVVSRFPVNTPRGLGDSLEEAVTNMADQESNDDDLL